MRYIELQLRANTLANMVANALRFHPLSFADTVKVDGRRELVIDRVDVSDVLVLRGQPLVLDYAKDDGSGAPQSVPVNAFEVAADVEFEMSVRTLTGRGTPTPAITPISFAGHDLSPFRLSMRVVLSVNLDGSGTPSIGFTPGDVTVPGDLLGGFGLSAWDAAAVTAEIEQRVKAAAPMRNLPLPWDPVRQRAKLTTPVAVGGAVRADSQAVAIRVQTEPLVEPGPRQWQVFHDGVWEQALPASSGSGLPVDWAVVVDGATAEDMIRIPLQDHLAAQHDLFVRAGPAVNFGIGSPARATVDLWVDVHHVEPLEPEVHVETQIVLDATSDGLLRCRTDSTGNVPGETLLGLGLDLFTPSLGILAAVSLVDAAAPSATSELLVGVLSAIASGRPVPLPPQPSPGWNCQGSGVLGVETCTGEGSFRYERGPGEDVTFWLDEVLTTATALVTRGHVVLPEPPPRPMLDTATGWDPAWRPPAIPCSAAGDAGVALAHMTDDPLATLAVTARIFVSGGTSTVRITGIELLSPDPDSALVDVVIDADGTSATVTFHVTAAYQAHRYGFALLVLTDGGAAVVPLAAVPEMTDALAKSLAVSAFARVARCFALESPFVRTFHRLDPTWAVDPGIGAREYVDLVWRVFETQLSEIAAVRSGPEEF